MCSTIKFNVFFLLFIKCFLSAKILPNAQDRCLHMYALCYCHLFRLCFIYLLCVCRVCTTETRCTMTTQRHTGTENIILRLVKFYVLHIFACSVYEKQTSRKHYLATKIKHWTPNKQPVTITPNNQLENNCTLATNQLPFFNLKKKKNVANFFTSITRTLEEKCFKISRTNYCLLKAFRLNRTLLKSKD